MHIKIYAIIPMAIREICCRKLVIMLVEAWDIEISWHRWCRVLVGCLDRNCRCRTSIWHSQGRSERWTVNLLQKSDRIDPLDCSRWVRCLNIISIKLCLHNCDTGPPNVIEVPFDPLTDCVGATIVLQLVWGPNIDWILVVRVPFGVEELDYKVTTHWADYCDVELFLSIIGIDRKNLDFFISMMVTNCVFLLELDRYCEVVATSVLQSESFDCIEFTTLHSDPFALILMTAVFAGDENVVAPRCVTMADSNLSDIWRNIVFLVKFVGVV